MEAALLALVGRSHETSRALELPLSSSARAGFPLCRAGLASKGQIAGAVERMIAQLLPLDIIPYVFFSPEGDRIYLFNFALLEELGVFPVLGFVVMQSS